MNRPPRQLNTVNTSNLNVAKSREANGIKGTKYANRKKQLLKLNNSQSNLIFPERDDLDEKLIGNRPNSRPTMKSESNGEQTTNLENHRSMPDNQSTRSDKPTKPTKPTKSTKPTKPTIPTIQIESNSDQLLNPFTLYQMYHENDLKFRSDPNEGFLSNLDELKAKTFNGQFEERRSFSSSFGKQYVCSNLFDDNVRSIDFVIVYDWQLYEYGQKFLQKSNFRSIIKQNSEESVGKRSVVSKGTSNDDNEKTDKQSNKSDPEGDKESELSKESDDLPQRANRLASPQNDDFNAELRRLSANDLDIVDQLDNNGDEEIEYWNTKITDSIGFRSTAVNKLPMRKPSDESIEIDSNQNELDRSIKELMTQMWKAELGLNEPEIPRMNLNTRQRYLAECCKRFEENLIAEGLELEYTEAKFVNTDARRIGFLKIHVPWEIICRYAEIMKLRMPIYDKNDLYSRGKFTAPYSKDKEYLFDIPADKRLFFSSAQRSQIVEFILKRKSFSTNLNDTSFGISKLLHEGGYIAAYPLHEGVLDVERPKKLDFDYDEEQMENEMRKNGDGSMNNFMKENHYSPRVQLFKNWASLKCIFRQQPLDEIRKYYGVKIGLYFAFLGFYTTMLVPASKYLHLLLLFLHFHLDKTITFRFRLQKGIVGICCFLYGVLTLDADIPTKQVCNKTLDNYPMCPLCNVKGCDFYYLSQTCSYMKFSYLFDNPGTVFFAIFMSFWSTVYLEMWKRYSSRITYRWDLSAFDTFEEFPRPEYLARLTKAEKKRLNLITKVYEPYIPFFKKHLNIVVSSSIVILLIMFALASVIGVIIYRVSGNLNNN